MRITLTVNGRPRAIEGPPLRRLLDILREDLELTGTKEGCGEGECGACAVLLDGQLVNACLVPALQLDGSEVLTIEGLGTSDRPDPVQQAFLEEGAVQCGFCIPGMVMASRALLDRDPRPSRAEIRRALAGNLCRCTGYERIFRAVERAAGAAGAARGRQPTPGVCAGSLPTNPGASRGREPAGDVAVHRPSDLAGALALLRDGGEGITVVAGATDLLAEIKLGRPAPRAVLDLTRLPDLAGIMRGAGGLTIGAATTFAAIASHADVRAHFPALAEAAGQIGAAAIQNRATIGGNLMTASPAADAPPVLLALGASALLASSAARREVPLAGFYTGYRRTVRQPGELLLGVRLPWPAADGHQAFHKVGPRLAQSIAKVSLAAFARLDDRGILRDVRLAAGSVAPTVVALSATQAYLEGRSLGSGDACAMIAKAQAIAAGEVVPIDDVRSTAEFRRAVLSGLVARFLRAVAGMRR